MFQEAALFRGLWGPGGRGVQYAVTVKRWGCMEARGSPGNGGALPTAAQQTGVLRSLGLQERGLQQPSFPAEAFTVYRVISQPVSHLILTRAWGDRCLYLQPIHGERLRELYILPKDGKEYESRKS